MKDGISVKEILLVEDDPASARLTELVIERSKIDGHVTTVATGEEATKVLTRQGPYAKTAKPDLVLLDITLPTMSGWDVLATIRDDPKLTEIPVVVLTASCDDRYVQSCYDLRADGFINKPMTVEKLDHLLESNEVFSLSLEPMRPEHIPPDIWY